MRQLYPLTFPAEVHIIEIHYATSDTLSYYQILLKQILPSLLSVAESEDQRENYSIALPGRNPDTYASWCIWCLFYTYTKEPWTSETAIPYSSESTEIGFGMQNIASPSPLLDTKEKTVTLILME